jgi:hypothetical protein
MPAVVPIGIGVASLVGAKMQSNAAKKAAAVQTDYGNRALDLQKQMYEQDRADQQPYRNIGYGALNTLGSMMGPKFNQGGGGFQPSMGGGGGGFSFNGPPSPSSPMGGGGGFMGGPRPGGSGQTPMASGSGGGMVLMQAPNGQTKQIPREQVAHYQQMGARVVG